ncbi:MAG: hypothetical protein JWN51_3399 [Phycisphaerales bacterium]|nr:hypothetical protein [Phycisphaerales bacterium]
MSFFSTFFGKGENPPNEPRIGPSPSDDGPFMEYPSDDYDSSLQAMTSALERLKTGGYGDRWITFSAQGKGHDEDSDQSKDVQVRDNTLDLRGQKLDVPALLQFGKLQGRVQVQVDSEGMVTLPGTTPEQMARFLDAVFQKHFGILPHDDEDDYAVGAEW